MIGSDVTHRERKNTATFTSKQAESLVVFSAFLLPFTN